MALCLLQCSQLYTLWDAARDEMQPEGILKLEWNPHEAIIIMLFQFWRGKFVLSLEDPLMGFVLAWMWTPSSLQLLISLMLLFDLMWIENPKLANILVVMMSCSFAYYEKTNNLLSIPRISQQHKIRVKEIKLRLNLILRIVV